MKLPCPACKEDIAVAATKCPYCQHVLTQKEQEERKSNRRYGYVGCGVLLLIAVVALTFCSSGGDEAEEPAPPGSASEEVVEAVSDFDAALSLQMAQCDMAAQQAAQIVSEGEVSDIYEAYRQATEASRTCLQKSSDIKAMDIPNGISGSARNTAQSAKEKCASAMFAKKILADDLAEILDGDSSPSKMQEFNDNGDYASIVMSECAVALKEVPLMAGISTDEAVTDQDAD